MDFRVPYFQSNQQYHRYVQIVMLIDVDVQLYLSHRGQKNTATCTQTISTKSLETAASCQGGSPVDRAFSTSKYPFVRGGDPCSCRYPDFKGMTPHWTEKHSVKITKSQDSYVPFMGTIGLTAQPFMVKPKVECLRHAWPSDRSPQRTGGMMSWRGQDQGGATDFQLGKIGWFTLCC